MDEHEGYVRYNPERRYIELLSCQGSIIALIPVSEPVVKSEEISIAAGT